MTGGENENECTAGSYFSACGWNDIIQDSILVNGIVHSGLNKTIWFLNFFSNRFNNITCKLQVPECNAVQLTSAFF